MNFPGRWKPRNSFKPDSRTKFEIMTFALMHSESNYFPMIDTTDVYALTQFTVRANRKCSVGRNIASARYIFSKVIHSPRKRESASSRRVAAICLLPETDEKESLLKGKLRTSATHIIHTHAHVSSGVSVFAQVSGTRPKSCPRAKSLIVSR